MPTSHARGLGGGRNVFSFQLSTRLLQEHSTQRASQPPGTSQHRSSEFPLDSLGWGRTGGHSPGIRRGGQGLGAGRGAKSDTGTAQGAAVQLGRGPCASSLLVHLGQQQDEGHGQGAVVEAVHISVVPVLQGWRGCVCPCVAFRPCIPSPLHAPIPLRARSVPVLWAWHLPLPWAPPQPPPVSWESGQVPSSKRPPLMIQPPWSFLPPNAEVTEGLCHPLTL